MAKISDDFSDFSTFIAVIPLPPTKEGAIMATTFKLRVQLARAILRTAKRLALLTAPELGR